MFDQDELKKAAELLKTDDLTQRIIDEIKKDAEQILARNVYPPPINDKWDAFTKSPHEADKAYQERLFEQQRAMYRKLADMNRMYGQEGDIITARILSPQERDELHSDLGDLSHDELNEIAIELHL